MTDTSQKPYYLGMTKSAQADDLPRWVDILRTLMTAQDLNPRSLSLKAGLGPTAVRDMLEGRARFPCYDTAQSLGKALGVTPAQLMGNEPLGASAPQTNDAEEDDLGLLTEIIARLQEAAQERRHQLEPRDFAAMVTTIYRNVAPVAGGKKPSISKLSSHIDQLISYETLRRKQSRR